VLAVAVLEPFSGWVDSPTHEYLWLVVVYAAFFYRAASYWLGCGVVTGIPLLYADRAVEHNLARECSSWSSPTRSWDRPVPRRAARPRHRRVGASGEPHTEAGQIYELEPADELVRLYATGRPVRMFDGDGAHESKTRALGYASFVAAPVYEGTSVWGTLGVAAHRANAFPPGAEDRLSAYTEMIATAVRNAEDRSRLDHQAGVDPLTGLPNHRAFHERLAEDVSRARRHERPLTVAVVDVDRFRELTESVGPEPADEALAEIGGLLRSAVRDEDVVARLGADEFGIAFLESDRSTALLAAERARQAVAGTPLRHGVRVTVSVGLCDLDAAPSADELLRRADAALFWSKEHGRDRSWIYDPSLVRDLAAYARRRDLETAQGLSGLRALARAIDAKDPATREHSERVAAMAARLAAERGWASQCVERLREAAALHDVGKIGVPDAVLLKPGRLDRSEMALMREHAALARVYRPPRAIQDALDEIRALAGHQFTHEAVEALEALHERGGLAMAAARMHRPTPEAATPKPA
jgi:diguanylate cyclase (GGDEF)-like protein